MAIFKNKLATFFIFAFLIAQGTIKTNLFSSPTGF